MIIHFDVDPHWTTTAGDLVENGRRYYAAAPPYMVILVVHEEVWRSIEDLPLNFKGATFVCNVGTEQPNEKGFGYTLPKYAGYAHTKITVRQEVVDTPADVKLSGILNGAPTEENPLGRYVPAKGSEYTLNLPPMLFKKALCVANDKGVDLGTLIWEVLLDHIEENY